MFCHGQFFLFSIVHVSFVLRHRIAVQFFLYLSILVMSISVLCSVMLFFVFANFINVIQVLVMYLNLRLFFAFIGCVFILWYFVLQFFTVFYNFRNILYVFMMYLNLRVYLFVFVFVIEVLFSFFYCIY